MRKIPIYTAAVLFFLLIVGPVNSPKYTQTATAAAQGSSAMPAIQSLLLSGYTVTVTAVGQGSVEFDPPPGGSYDDGTLVTVTATPDSGWRFLEWGGDLTGSINPETLTMDGDQSVTATFIQIHSLGVTTQGQGDVMADPTDGPYDHGMEVTLTALPDTGYRFDSWSGDANGTNNPVTVLMDSDKSVTATFEIKQYSLNVTKIGSGSVTRNPNLSVYDHGTVVTLTASAASGYRFGGWSGDASGTSTQVFVTMDSDKSVTATFIQQHTLTVSTAPPGSGSVSRNPDTATYDNGSSVLLSASAASGWRFSHWSGHLSGSTNPIYIFMNTDKSVTANFVEVHTLSVTTEPDDSGSVTLDPPVQPDIDWQGEFFEFSYQVNSNGGTFYNKTVGNWQEINSFDSRDETNGSYSGTVETTVSPSWGFIEMKAGSMGPEASTSPPDGLLVKGYAEMNLNGFNPANHGVLLTAPADGIDVLSLVSRRFSVDTPGQYLLGAVIRGDISFNVFGSRSASYFSSRGVSGEVELEKFVVNEFGTATSLGVVTRLTMNMLDSDQAQVILYPQIGGNNIVYQLKAVLHLRAELQNLIFPSTITSGTEDFVGPFKLGSVANPLELETFFFFTGRAYDHGTEVTLTAVPNSGWQFKEWSGDLSGSDNPETLIMNSDKSVTANFEIEQHTLTVDTSGEGTVELDPAAGPYNHGTEVTLTATPASGWMFSEWSGDVTGTDNPVTVTMDSDKSVTATFTDILPDVAITKTANPTSVPASGGDVEFTIEVANNSLEDGTIDSLSDNVFGDLNGQGTCATGGTIAAGETYTCTFTEFIDDPDHLNTVTVQVSDGNGNTATASDNATVTFTE